MEQISHKARNLQMNLLMGKLYRYSRNHRSAVTCYKECLRFVKNETNTVLCHFYYSVTLYTLFIFESNVFISFLVTPLFPLGAVFIFLVYDFYFDFFSGILLMSLRLLQL